MIAYWEFLPFIEVCHRTGGGISPVLEGRQSSVGQLSSTPLCREGAYEHSERLSSRFYSGCVLCYNTTSNEVKWIQQSEMASMMGERTKRQQKNEQSAPLPTNSPSCSPLLCLSPCLL